MNNKQLFGKSCLCRVIDKGTVSLHKNDLKVRERERRVLREAHEDGELPLPTPTPPTNTTRAARAHTHTHTRFSLIRAAFALHHLLVNFALYYRTVYFVLNHR